MTKKKNIYIYNVNKEKTCKQMLSIPIVHSTETQSDSCFLTLSKNVCHWQCSQSTKILATHS